MASVINDSVRVFSLVSVDDWVAASNLSSQMKSIQLRLIFMPHKFKLMLDIFGHTIRINQNPEKNKKSSRKAEHAPIVRQTHVQVVTNDFK